MSEDRLYIVPMAQYDLDLREHLPELKEYGVDKLRLISSVFHSILRDEVNYHLDVANFVRSVIQKRGTVQDAGKDHRIPTQLMIAEIDRATIACLEICDQIERHIRKYMDDIDKRESERLDGGEYYFYIHGTLGDDLVLGVSDHSDPRSL